MKIAKIFITLLIFAFPFTSFSQEAKAKPVEPLKIQKCSSLGLYLTDCSKFKCVMSNPKIPSQKIVQEIKGFDEDGKCVHQQQMSKSQIITCKYSEESRKYIAIRMEQNKEKNFTDPKQEYLEKRLMEDIFIHECDITDL